jgi:hypothetical protein
MNAETVVAQSPVSALDGVFDALVKAVADRIVTQMMESPAVEAKISSVLETVLSDRMSDEIDSWFANNFSIHDYDQEINQMIDVEDEVRNIVKDMSFTISVD